MIVVVGSTNVDFTVYTDRIPGLAETVTGSEYKVAGGGKGANQAVGAARLGAKTRLLTKLGDADKYVELLREHMQWAGVEEDDIEMVPGGLCGAAFIYVDKNAQNNIVIIPLANAEITPEYVQAHEDTIAKAGVVICEFGVPMEACKKAMELGRKHKVTTLVNPAPVQPMDDAFFAVTDIIAPNEVEAEQLTGIAITDEKSADKAAEYFHGKGVKSVVITVGERGSYVSCADGKQWIQPYKVKAIDTVAAGDSFIAGLAYSLEQGKNLIEAAQFASAVGAMCVTRKGAMPSMPSLQEVEALIAGK